MIKKLLNVIVFSFLVGMFFVQADHAEAKHHKHHRHHHYKMASHTSGKAYEKWLKYHRGVDDFDWSQSRKGPHMDEDGDLDPDEWPNPKFDY